MATTTWAIPARSFNRLKDVRTITACRLPRGFRRCWDLQVCSLCVCKWGTTAAAAVSHDVLLGQKPACNEKEQEGKEKEEEVKTASKNNKINQQGKASFLFFRFSFLWGWWMGGGGSGGKQRRVLARVLHASTLWCGSLPTLVWGSFPKCCRCHLVAQFIYLSI